MKTQTRVDYVLWVKVPEKSDKKFLPTTGDWWHYRTVPTYKECKEYYDDLIEETDWDLKIVRRDYVITSTPITMRRMKWK